MFVTPLSALTDARLTIEPQPCSFICSPTERVILKTLLILTSIAMSRSSSFALRNGATGVSAALLTRPKIEPCVVTILLIVSSISFRSVMSTV